MTRDGRVVGVVVFTFRSVARPVLWWRGFHDDDRFSPVDEGVVEPGDLVGEESDRLLGHPSFREAVVRHLLYLEPEFLGRLLEPLVVVLAP